MAGIHFIGPSPLSYNPPIEAGYDTDAQAFFTAVEGGGDTLTDTEKNAVNTLVLTLKSDGIWNSMQAVYPFVGGTGTSMKWNLKDPRDLDAAYRITWTGTYTYDANGVQGSATQTSQRGDTKYTVNTNSAGDGLHMSMYINAGTADAGYDLGANDGAAGNDEYLLVAGFGNNTLYSRMGGTQITYSGATMPNGFFSSTGTSSTQILYRNGSSVASGGVRVIANSQPIFISNRSGNITQPKDSRYAFVSLGLALDATGHSNLYTAVQAFQTSLSRQV